MAKVINAVDSAAPEAIKMVSIKHTRVMQNANGNDVTVLDYFKNIRKLKKGIKLNHPNIHYYTSKKNTINN